MQYPVPQFTDVEDKIIGPLTLKQAAIIGGTGFMVFFVFSATKSVGLVIIMILFLGIPAVFMAFGKLNGRPIYNNIFPVVQYFLNPKMLMFHKEGTSLSDDALVEQYKAENPENITITGDEDASAKLKKLNYQLQQQAIAQEELLSRK